MNILSVLVAIVAILCLFSLGYILILIPKAGSEVDERVDKICREVNDGKPRT